jgi:hypothetical protein
MSLFPQNEEARVNRFPIAFAQTVAFAAAIGSVAWQVLRLALQRGATLGSLAIALVIAGSFAAGALIYSLILIPLRNRMAAQAEGGRHPTRLLLLNILIATVWVLAWAAPGFQFVARGGIDAFWGFVCFSMGGLSGALFYEPLGSSRTPV